MAKGFTGLRNDVEAERFRASDLVTANNVDIDSTGMVSRRDGYARQVSADCHSLWADDDLCLYVTGTSLKRLATDYTSTTLRSDLTAGLRMSYWKENGVTYYSNGKEKGIVQNGVDRTWGLAVPGLPMAANSVGRLFPGIYQYSMTYIRSDGQESGAGLAGQVTVSDGGIYFSDIPVSDDPDVSYKVIYLSPADGDVLYQALFMDNADTTATYGDDGVNLQMPLRSQFMQGAPAGQIVGFYKGRAYVVDGNLIYPSQPFSPELFDIRDYIQYPDRVTLFAPVIDGIWLGTEKQIWFLSGTGPEDFTAIPKAGYGAIFGTLAYNFQQGNNGEVRYALWASDLGICSGYPGGQFANLTESKYRYTKPNEGCALLRIPTTTGPTQYLTVLR